jgi:hypothetical protein
VAIEIPPTECDQASFEAILDYILQQEGYEQYNFNLGPTAQKFFDSIAAEQGLSPRYITFIKSLFPKRDTRRKKSTRGLRHAAEQKNHRNQICLLTSLP